MGTYTYPKFEVRSTQDLQGTVQRRPLIIIGAGPVGLAAAMMMRGRRCTVPCKSCVERTSNLG